jgi:hypothetical protein
MSHARNIDARTAKRALTRIEDALTRLDGHLARALEAARMVHGLDADRTRLEVCHAQAAASTVGVALGLLKSDLAGLLEEPQRPLERELALCLSTYALEAPCQTI